MNVVPKKLKDDENKALTTPLTVTGTAEELDAELGSTLIDFVGSHLQLKNTLTPGEGRHGNSCKGCPGRSSRQGEDSAEEGCEHVQCVESRSTRQSDRARTTTSTQDGELV